MYDFDDHRIKDLVHGEYDGADVNTIDFKRHLKPTISLNKMTFKDNQGRPSRAEYYYNDLKIAVIHYIFTVDGNNLMTSRREVLRYIKLDGNEGSDILIKTKHFDFSNPTDLEKVITERQIARASIIAELKGTVSGVMQGLGWSIDHIVSQGRPFWVQMGPDMSDFIEFGSLDWRDKLIAIDLTKTLYTWLSLPLDANGTTLRDYIVSRLTY